MQGVLQQGQKQQKFNSSGNHLQQSIRKHMLDAQCPLNWLQQDSSNELARGKYPVIHTSVRNCFILIVWGQGKKRNRLFFKALLLGNEYRSLSTSFHITYQSERILQTFNPSQLCKYVVNTHVYHVPTNDNLYMLFIYTHVGYIHLPIMYLSISIYNMGSSWLTGIQL